MKKQDFIMRNETKEIVTPKGVTAEDITKVIIETILKHYPILTDEEIEDV
ncbi:hypothetical protein LCGC14_2770970, partial [marine sediment metagenome]